MVVIKRLSLGVLLLLIMVVAALYYQLNNVPSLEPYQNYFKASTHPTSSSVFKLTGAKKLTATYFGTSTVLISDGETSIMTDGFFSRPTAWDLVFGNISPDQIIIKEALLQTNVSNLAAVIPIHSHHDHAMDAPVVVQQTGAMLVGSQSTANIGRGWGLDESQIKVVSSGEALKFGQFSVRLIASQHAPAPEVIEELTGAGLAIEEPLTFPAKLSDFKEGGSFSVLVEHPLGNVLVHGSAGFKEGALAGIKADVVFLGIAGLGKKDAYYQERYFKELVSDVGATRIIPVHWDDFTQPFNETFRPMVKMIDDFDGAMEFIINKEKQDNNLSLHMMGRLDSMVLYSGLNIY